jgi:hypothetical protein
MRTSLNTRSIPPTESISMDFVKSAFHLGHRPDIIIYFDYKLLKYTRSIENTFTEFLFRVIDSAVEASPSGRTTIHLITQFKCLAHVLAKPNNPFIKKQTHRPNTRTFLKQMMDKFNSHYRNEVIEKVYIYLDQDIASLLNPLLGMVSKADVNKLEFKHRKQLPNWV